MLSVPTAVGVKLTVDAKEAPPLNAGKHDPEALIVAVALVIAPAAKLTEGAGVPVQAVSLRMVVTGLSVAEGLTGVPTADAGTVTLPTVICASVSLPPVAIKLE